MYEIVFIIFQHVFSYNGYLKKYCIFFRQSAYGLTALTSRTFMESNQIALPKNMEGHFKRLGTTYGIVAEEISEYTTVTW